MFNPYWYEKNNYHNYRGNSILKNIKILDFARGKITEDSTIYNVYLVGNLVDSQESFANNITLLIQNGVTGLVKSIPIGDDSGYDVRLFLGDFDGDGIDDIFVRIASEDNVLYSYFYVYSMKKKKPIIIFDFDEFNMQSNYTVVYENYYKVKVINQNASVEYILDISYKGKRYLSQMYDPQGRLIEIGTLEGQVLSLDRLYPLYNYENRIFNLLSYQRIIGISNSDTLGFVIKKIKWNEMAQEFNSANENVSIFSKLIT